MRHSSARTITYAWIILSAITILSWCPAAGHTRGAVAVASAPITLALILLGFIKGPMIIRYVVEVRPRTAVAQLFHAGWLTAVWTGTLAIYLH
jgi:hypothetical protein